MEASLGRAVSDGLSLRQCPDHALFERWCEDRDEVARNELVRRHLPLAHKLAVRYARSQEPLEDLMQVASVGLLHAIDRYDPSREKAFQSFAVPTILGELKRHFRDKGWSIHFPRGLHDQVQRVQAAEQQLMATSNRSPTVVEIAGHLGVQTERVLDALEAARTRIAVSLDQPIQGENDAEPQSWHDRVGSEDEGFGLVEARVSLPPAVTRLPASDRELLALRYQAQLTQHQIAARVGVSQMSVSRRLRAVTDRLRDELYGSPASAPRGDARPTLAPPSPAR